MILSSCRAAVSVLALGWSSLVLAGDEPLYEPAPEWVDEVQLDTIERDPANIVGVRDVQIRIEKGRHWEYNDTVVRLAGVSQLAEAGTLNASWLPDKGDLIVHRIDIIRDGEVIDLVAAGERMEVLRREERLEEQIVDGALTATLSVPGLQIGDDLRITYSVTRSDQVLGDEVQSQAYLWRKPDSNADFARVRVSWPEDLAVSYEAGPNFDLAPAELRDGHEWLEVALPLPKEEELPADAPLRFRRPTLLQVGTFEDWAEVSRVMAPFYSIEGSLGGLDDLDARIEAIRSASDSDLARAVDALELVQEDIRYLMNGLDGGNYRPQDVATTWEKKYGDCKAKTLILLAILDRLGIAAEAVLVSTDAGNAVPESLPLPGVFNHVIVRASIDGQLYYLDGTSLGANIALVGNVPEYEYALPIRAEGAGLEPIEQVLPRVPEFTMNIEVDASAGADLPTLARLEVNFIGQAAAQLSAVADMLTEERKREMARSMESDINLLEVDIVPGDDDSEVSMVMTGIMQSPFEFDGTRAEMGGAFMTGSVDFSPDRSRRDWRQIPVAIGAATAAAINLRAILPHSHDAYELRGKTALDEVVAGRRYQRDVDFAEGVLTLSESVVSNGGEIAPDAVSAERRKAASFARNEFKLVANEELPRRWRFAQSKDRKALAALEAAYAKLIENDPDEADPYLTRAAFRFDTYDWEGSLEDMNRVIEIEGTAEYYSQRSTVYSKLLDLEAARDDLEEAYLLEPTPWRAMHFANALFDLGDIEGARAILEDEDGDEEVRQYLALALANLDAFEGKGAEGLARIEEAIGDDLNNADMLNKKCWYMGTWQVEIESALAVCNRAVEVNGSADALDSRALIHYRNGMVAEALADLDAALGLDPDLPGSVFLRGAILREMGERAGQAAIEEALARDPEIATAYGKWGFEL